MAVGRIWSLALSCVVCLCVSSFVGHVDASPPPDQPNLVSVDAGQLRGAVAGDLVVFKGIPYAAAPVGDLRWRAPQPVKPWSGVRAADAFGCDCMQKAFPFDAAPPTQTPSEDCLFLNIWKPLKANGKLAVLVWIHGGGYVNGAGSPAVYDGSQLARQGLVVVSINYRLGRFGFFAHPALTKESPSGPLGNYAFLDQIAALQWVKRNIAAFGGDPSNVTIYGESAGGGSVNALMTSPLAKGLFHKGIVDSGGGRPGGFFGMPRLHEDGPGGRPSAEATGKAFASSVGISGDDASALAALRALPAEKVLNGMNMGDMQNQTYSGPMIDGQILPEDPGDVFARGEQAKVPYLVGANSYEFGMIPGGAGIADGLLKQLASSKDAIVAAYDPKKTGDRSELNSHLMSDVAFVEPSRFTARQVARAGEPAYLYRFSYVAEHLRSSLPGAPHASELPYVFDTLAAANKDQVSSSDRATASAMCRYWANFAKTGDPNGEGLPKWPSFSGTSEMLMDFTVGGPVARPDPIKERLDAIEAAHGKE